MVSETLPAKITTLPPMKEAFCQFWNRCHNASASAIKAGYSIESSRSIGYNLLQEPDVKQRIKEIDEAEGPDPLIASAPERRRILSEIARASVTDFQTKDGLQVSGESPNVRAIRGIDVDASGKVKRLKLADAVAAIQEHNKMDGIGRDTVPVTDARTVIINVTSPDTRAMLNAVSDCLLPPAIDCPPLPQVVKGEGIPDDTATNEGVL